MRARYETSAEQLVRLKQDAAKFAKGHARLIANTGNDFHKVKTSREVFRAKVYNERLHAEDFRDVVELFEDLVGKELDALLADLHAA